jgi:hypothetical protein
MMKYLVLMRSDCKKDTIMMEKILMCILKGYKIITMSFYIVFVSLEDEDDDVRGIVAESMLFICNECIQGILTEELRGKCREYFDQIVEKLWQSLHQLDDLSHSISNIMKLLSKPIHNSNYNAI